MLSSFDIYFSKSQVLKNTQLFYDFLNLVTFLLRGCVKVELSILFYL